MINFRQNSNFQISHLLRNSIFSFNSINSQTWATEKSNEANITTIKIQIGKRIFQIDKILKHNFLIRYNFYFFFFLMPIDKESKIKELEGIFKWNLINSIELMYWLFYFWIFSTFFFFNIFQHFSTLILQIISLIFIYFLFYFIFNFSIQFPTKTLFPRIFQLFSTFSFSTFFFFF